jgi:PAS domain S-box-containing protein
MFEEASFLAIILDRKGKIEYLNAKARALLEYRDSGTGGDWFALHFPPETLPDRLKEFEEFFTNKHKRYRSVETPVKTIGGGALLVRWDLFQFQENGEEYLLGLGEDVSEAQKTLRESNTRFRSLVDAMPLGIHQYFLTPDDRLIFTGANPAADSILHVKHEAFISLEMLEAFPALRDTDIPLRYREVARGGAVFHREETTYKDNRIVGAFEIHAFNTGEMRMAVAFSDIFERKKAEIERDNFFNLSMDIVVLANLDGFFKDVNPAATEILGWSKEELLSRPWLDFIHPDDIQMTKDAGEGLKKGKRVNLFENRYRCKDGSYRWLSWNSMPITGQSMIVAVVRDITEQKQQMESLRQLEKLEAIGRLAGGVAHDFNNQLAGIMGCAEIIQAKLPPESGLHQYLDLIIASTKASADLAGQLLAFARKGKFQSIPLDIHLVINNALSLLSHTIDRKISIEGRLEAGSHTIEGDPSQIQNALMNLGINARDAMPDGGSLVVGTETVELDGEFLRAHDYRIDPGRYIVVSVRDSGTGIDPEIRKHLFEPFYTTKAEGKGTGLGLAAVYGIVKSHRGAIDVESRVGEGTTFKLFFPLVAAEKASAEASKGQPAPEGHSSILIVDDEKTICMMASAMLSLAGYTVEFALSGADALARLRSGAFPDLIFMDMVMPDMNGRELFSEIRKEFPNAKVLLSSGNGINEESQGMLDAGARGFIQKPYRKDALYAAVAEALKG